MILKKILHIADELIFKRIQYHVVTNNDGDNIYWKKITNNKFFSIENSPLHEIIKIQSSYYIKSSFNDLINNCNNRSLRIRITAALVSFVIAVVSSFVWYFLFSLTTIILVDVVIYIFFLVLLLLYFDRNNYLIYIYYSMNNKYNEFNEGLSKHLRNLMSSDHTWSVDSIVHNENPRFFCALSDIYDRSELNSINKMPFYMQSNLSIICFSNGNKRIYFFPDFIFIEEESFSSQILSYKSLSVKYIEKPFCEYEYPLFDNNILKFTWFHQKKDGTGDRRFKNNFEVPVVLYGEIIISLKDNVYIHFQISDNKKAFMFSEFIKSYVFFYSEELFHHKETHYKNNDKRVYTEEERKRTAYNYDFRQWYKNYFSGKKDNAKNHESVNDREEAGRKNKHQQLERRNNLWAYKVLGVKIFSTKEEIKKAYIDLVKIYHPDKHIRKDLQIFKEAEERLKIINKAYDSLSR